MYRVTAPARPDLDRPDPALNPALLAGPEVHVEPPYPGAIQDELAWHLVKYLREDARLRSEVGVEVPEGPGHGPAYFTLDLVVDVPVDGLPGGTRRVVFEAGSAGSPGAALRDHDRLLRRDATVLAVGAADTVYRLRGTDLLHHMDDVLFLASQWDADVFSERGRINLRTLASPEAKALTIRPEQPSVLVPYALDPDEAADAPERHLWHVANGQTPHVLVRRLDRRLPAVWAPHAADGFAPSRLRRVDAEPLRKAG
jgi:hypothetical protein